jgi:hypothetical protein
MMEKRQSLQQMLLGKVVICLQKTETRSMFITPYCINSKWIKDLNIRPKTLKLAQERSGNTREAIGTGKDFLNRIPELSNYEKGWTNGTTKIKKILYNKKKNGL